MTKRNIVECDNCGKQENRPYGNDIPRSWKTLGSDRLRHLCGWNCVIGYAARQIQEEKDKGST